MLYHFNRSRKETKKNGGSFIKNYRHFFIEKVTKLFDINY